MTDGLVAESVSQNQVSQSNINSNSSASAIQSAPVTSTVEKPVEKMLRQSEVNDIIGSVKKEAYEKGKREAASQPMQQPVQQHEQTIGGVSQLSDEKIRQLINEESQKKTNYDTAQRIAQEFTQKMMAAKDKYPDFESTVTKLNLPQIPHIVNWANSLDNTADVMYEIAKYPAKFASIMTLAYTSPHLAVEEMQRLSNSIKQNEAAVKQQTPAEPLSQVKPSTTGADNGSMSITDYRKQSWLRG